MKRISFLFLAIVASALVSFVGDEISKGQTTLKVDTQASKLVWTGKKFTGQHTGNIALTSGNLIVTEGKLKGGTFEIDARTITVTDITDSEQNAKLVKHLKGDDFFGVEKFPKATLTITSATPKGGDAYDLSGKLTIKGVTNTVSFPAVVKIEKDKATATAKIVVNRTKYDIKYGSKSFFPNIGDKFIYDDFELDVNIVASGQSTATAKAK